MSQPSPTGYMRAVQWEGNIGDISVNIVPRPKILEPEDALVRITSSAICGSDLHIYHGLFGTKGVPHSIGHEAVGIIEEVGPAVDSFKRGDRVVVPCFAEDGHLLPKPSLQPFGEAVAHGLGSQYGLEAGLQSAFSPSPCPLSPNFLTNTEPLAAEFARIPWADSALIKIPNKLDDKEWLPLADVFPTGWSGLSFSGFEAGDTVAVFGAGGVGLMCAYSAIIRGASLVYVVDHVPARLAQAAAIGAMPINFTRGGKASEQILALRPGGVNRAVDCVGEVCLNDEMKPQQDYIIREAIRITSVNGGVGIPGLHMAGMTSAGGEAPDAAEKLGLEAEIRFPIADLWSKNLRVQGGLVSFRECVPHIAQLIGNGRARPGFIFSNEYSLEDAPLAYSRFEKWEETKVLLMGNRKLVDGRGLEIRSGSDRSNGGSDGSWEK
ncbi:glutathione-independent formaldehyde dehydrogenase [Candidatus Bathyarchaeota archaeon]|nr:glutathione-independent formaldehyde dehydrogenase [Candidatus Bathyarchaeota archaeon]